MGLTPTSATGYFNNLASYLGYIGEGRSNGNYQSQPERVGGRP